MKRLIIALLIAGVFSNSATLAKVSEFTGSNEKIKATVGFGKQNRIELEHSRILEIIGNNAEYSLIFNPDSSYLFLIPKAKTGNIIELSIIHGDKQVQELSLAVASISSRTILIRDTRTNKGNNSLNYPTEDNSRELSQMLRYMIPGKTGKYNVKRLSYPVPFAMKDLKIVFDLKYSFAKAGLTGRRLKLRNTGLDILKLSEEMFAYIFENVIAINLSKWEIGRNEEGFVYLISEVRE